MPLEEPKRWTLSAGPWTKVSEQLRSPISPIDFAQAFDPVAQALSDAAQTLGDARRAAEDKLTEQQFIEAMRQALASGDFLRLVRDDGSGQAITYEPFRERERLKARIRTLESALIAIQEAFDAIH